jgi:dephospho-CoA kinase
LTGTDKVIVVESALIFSAVTNDESSWQTRFDRILLVVAPEEQKVGRFVARQVGGRAVSGEERTDLEAEARRRLAMQETEGHASECIVIHNDGDLAKLESQVAEVWTELEQLARLQPSF